MKNELVGKAFEELSFEEMALEQGASVEARTSVACIISASMASNIWCAATAIGGSLLSLKIC